jgi:serine/threonine-protein kinase
MDQLLADLAMVEQEFAGSTVASTEITGVTRPVPKYFRRRRVLLLIVVFASILLFPLSLPVIRGWLYTFFYSAPMPAQKQLAILPFVNNLGKDPQNDALCAGLLEYITNRLTELELFQEDLHVVSSSEVVRGDVKSPRDALQLFGATLVVTGSVQRDRGDVLVVMNLVDPKTSLQLRAGMVRAPASDMSNLQTDVLEKLASMLEVEFRHRERALATAGSSAAPGATELYLKGRGFLLRYDNPENLDHAYASFGKALTADANYALAHAGIAEVQWRRFRSSRDGRHLEEARAECLKAIELDSQLAPVHITMGRIEAAGGRHEQAIESFRRALKLDRKNQDAPRELASSFDAIGRLKEAEAAYKTAIDLRPHYWAVYNEMGVYKFRRRNYREAILYFEKVIELTPDNPLAYRNLGGVHLELGELEEASRNLQQSLKIKPTARAYSNLGTVYYYQERYADAVHVYEKAVALAPNDARLWGNLADAYRWSPGLSQKATDTYRRAIQLAERELKLNPRDLPLRAYIALCRSASGEHDQAKKEAAEVVQLAPRDGTVLFRAAIVFEQAGDRKRALNLLGRALAAGFSLQQVRRAVPLADLRKQPEYMRLESRHQMSQDTAQ